MSRYWPGALLIAALVLTGCGSNPNSTANATTSTGAKTATSAGPPAATTTVAPTTTTTGLPTTTKPPPLPLTAAERSSANSYVSAHRASLAGVLTDLAPTIADLAEIGNGPASGYKKAFKQAKADAVIAGPKLASALAALGPKGTGRVGGQESQVKQALSLFSNAIVLIEEWTSLSDGSNLTAVAEIQGASEQWDSAVKTLWRMGGDPNPPTEKLPAGVAP